MDPMEKAGSPAILVSLLDYFDGKTAVAYCEKNFLHYSKKQHTKVPIYRLATLPMFWSLKSGYRIRKLLRIFGFPILLLRGICAVRRFQPEVIVTVYYNWRWIISSFILGKLFGKPVVFYVHDLLSENYFESKLSWVANSIESYLFKNSIVVALHPGLARYLESKHGIIPEVLRHVVDGEFLKIDRTSNLGYKVIGFAGAIYENNVKELRELSRVLESIPELELILFTSKDSTWLSENGIDPERIKVRFCESKHSLIDALSRCDLLFLPLSFEDHDSLTQKALSFAFPTKSIDYLLSGTPILVYSPSSFELTRFFKQHEAANVVTENRPGTLEKWLSSWSKGSSDSVNACGREKALKEFPDRKAHETLFRSILKRATELSPLK